MEKQVLFNLVSAQRYYHLVAFKPDSSYSIQSFWNECGIQRSQEGHINYDLPNFKIEYRKVISNIPFFNGDKDYSVNKDGLPPFNYDMFGLEIKKSNVFIFGFPFKLLAKTVLRNLIENKRLISKGSFVKADLNKLIKINSDRTLTEGAFTSRFIGIELTITGDTKITSVYLDGDEPLKSTLYNNVFSKLINEDKCKVEKCSMKCETSMDESLNIPKTKSIIHIDLFGNYKLYIHGTGNNIFTIPLIFNLLGNLDCLDYTLINPIKSLQDDQI